MEAKPSRSRPSNYLPTLDGWRTISILAVMLCHDQLHTLGPLSSWWFYTRGNVGVDIFFAISGLLICSRLMTEERTKGSISLKGFYIRRAFRILPPALFFLFVLVVLKYTIHLPVGLPEIGAAILFVHNYTSAYMPFQSEVPFYTSHFWSLAVEEHFYLFLPPLLVFAPRKWRVPALLAIAAAVGIHRMAPYSWESMHTDMRIDALLIPAAIAIVLTHPPQRIWLQKAVRFWPVVAVVLVSLITWQQITRSTGLLIAWLTPFVVLGTMLHPNALFSRFLELPPMRFVGRLSYSLYLWQQLFLLGHFGSGSERMGALQAWPLGWGMTFGCALFSYYLVEQPCIQLGHRLAPNVAANRVQRAPNAVEE